MRDAIIEIIPGLIVGLLWLLIWTFLFRYLAKLKGKLTVSIRQKVLPDVDRASNSLTTLSAAAIVLTFSILQIWSTKAFVKEYYLIISWTGFAFAVFIGAMQSVASYIYKTYYLLMMNSIDDGRTHEKLDQAEEYELHP